MRQHINRPSWLALCISLISSPAVPVLAANAQLRFAEKNNPIGELKYILQHRSLHIVLRPLAIMMATQMQPQPRTYDFATGHRYVEPGSVGQWCFDETNGWEFPGPDHIQSWCTDAMRCDVRALLRRLRPFDVRVTTGLSHGYKTMVRCRHLPPQTAITLSTSTANVFAFSHPFVRSQRFHPHLPTGSEGQNR